MANWIRLSIDHPLDIHGATFRNLVANDALNGFLRFFIYI